MRQGAAQRFPRRIGEWAMAIVYPGRDLKKWACGHLGAERVTVQNLKVMQVRESESIILVAARCPGVKRDSLGGAP